MNAYKHGDKYVLDIKYGLGRSLYGGPAVHDTLITRYVLNTMADCDALIRDLTTRQN